MDSEARLTLAYFRAYPLEATTQLETWSAEEIAATMRPFPTQDIALVLDHFSSDQAAAVLRLLPTDQTADIITALPTASAIGILRQYDPPVQRELFAKLDSTVGPGLRLSLAYPDGTAASLADPRVVILPPDIPVSRALERIRQDPQRATYYHYVVERDGQLAGLVTTKELLVADPAELVATIMKDQLETVSAESTDEELLQDPNWRLYHTLPVVDRERHFLGILRYRTLRRLEERSEIRHTAGALPQALLHMWEAYAFIGLRIMTDMAQIVETSVAEAAPSRPNESEIDNGATPGTP